MAVTRVLIIDDSALIRKVLTEILSQDPNIEVVGAAPDPYIARDKIKLLQPDVLTLDVEMPRMDGLTFLKNLMRLRPMPVVMISTLTEAGADVTLQALELGAVDYIAKPKIDVNVSIKDYTSEICEKVRMAAKVSVEVLRQKYESASEQTRKISADTIGAAAGQKFLNTTDKLIAIGSSTGGTEAVKEVLIQLPAHTAGIVVSQHIPRAFSGSFARRLNEITSLNVAEATHGAQIRPGTAFIAPGDKHLKIRRSGARYFCELDDGPEVNRHKPSVDVMFDSVASSVGPNAMGVILTGMGADGAQGLLNMHNQNAFTIAQDEKSSVVWGMPGAAVKLNAADKILNLKNIAQEIIHFCEKE